MIFRGDKFFERVALAWIVVKLLGRLFNDSEYFIVRHSGYPTTVKILVIRVVKSVRLVDRS